jgi:hypothetical protein
LSSDEVPGLIAQLTRRPGAVGTRLDLSPESLRLLEGSLVKIVSSWTKEPEGVPEDDVVRLVREVAAYLAEVLILHAKATFDEGLRANLLDTGLSIPGPWIVMKDTTFVSPGRALFTPGSSAASAVHNAWEGKRQALYETFRSAVSKRLREGYY